MSRPQVSKLAPQHARAAATSERGCTPFDTRTTAYAWNNRPGTDVVPREQSEWCARIESLLCQDYTFLGIYYEPDAFLFRGMASAVGDVLSGGCVGHFDSEHALSLLERQLGVYFVSHEISDAIATARPWERRHDWAIVVLPSARFTAEWKQRRAAVMGFAEPGVVFRYPILTEPVPISDIAAMIVSPAAQHSCDGSVDPNVAKHCAHVSILSPTLDDAQWGNRTAVSACIERLISSNHFTPASPSSTPIRPQRATR